MNPLAAAEIARLYHLIAVLADPADPNLSVHTTRKGIKRLRAFLRLARRSIGTTTYRIENGALRDTARLLAPVRDSYVLIETAGDLGAPDGVLAEFRAEYAEAMVVFESVSRLEAVHHLEAIARRWQLLPWQGPDAKSIGSGLARTYRRGLVDFETVLTTPSESAFHGWRRRTKYLRYQLEVLHAPEELVLQYVDLGDALGLEHDQTVLLTVCELHANHESYASLGRRSFERRQQLRDVALELGAPLFDREPESFRQLVEETIGPR